MSVIIQASKLVYFPHLLSTAYSSSLSSFALLRRGHAPLALEVIRLTICVSSIVLYVMMYCVSTRAAIPLSMTSMPDRCCELNASVGLLGTFPREIGLSVRLFVYLFVVFVRTWCFCIRSSPPRVLSYHGSGRALINQYPRYSLRGPSSFTNLRRYVFAVRCSLQRVRLWLLDDTVVFAVPLNSPSSFSFIWKCLVVTFLRRLHHTVGIDRSISRVDAYTCAERIPKRHQQISSFFSCNFLWVCE